jgi:hypothetical protein
MHDLVVLCPSMVVIKATYDSSVVLSSQFTGIAISTGNGVFAGTVNSELLASLSGNTATTYGPPDAFGSGLGSTNVYLRLPNQDFSDVVDTSASSVAGRIGIWSWLRGDFCWWLSIHLVCKSISGIKSVVPPHSLVRVLSMGLLPAWIKEALVRLEASSFPVSPLPLDRTRLSNTLLVPQCSLVNVKRAVKL